MAGTTARALVDLCSIGQSGVAVRRFVARHAIEALGPFRSSSEGSDRFDSDIATSHDIRRSDEKGARGKGQWRKCCSTGKSKC